MDNYTGYSTRIINLVKGLEASGNNVSVILPKYQAGYKLLDGIPVYELNGLCPKFLLKLVGRFCNIAKPSALYFFDVLFLFRASQLVRNADIVQIELPALSVLLSSFIHRTLRKPVVMDCHDVFAALRLKHVFPRRIAETFLEKVALKNADFLVVVSKKEKQILGYLRFPWEKIVVAPNGVNLASFSKPADLDVIRKKYKLDDSRVIVFVGNLGYEPNRQAVELISKTIAPRVKQEFSDTKFLIVGKIRDKMDLPGVTFTGFVDNVADLLAVSDVGIAPLLEGSGTRLKILEYLSSGLPVISTSVGAEGLRAENGNNILIEDKIEKFGGHIIELLKDSEWSLAMGEAAKELAANYDWKKITKKLDYEYRSFLKKFRTNPEQTERTSIEKVKA
jgi:glycosyltransferase involved in cell wall biosynthesis